MYARARRLGAALILLAADVAAQTNASNWGTVKALTAGTDVRVTNVSRTVSGKIESVTDGTIVVSSGKGQETFGQQQVWEVSVRRAGHRGRNALIGTAIGAGAGLVIGLAARAGPNQIHFVSNGVVVAAGTAGGAIVETIVGIVIPSGGWHEIYKK